MLGLCLKYDLKSQFRYLWPLYIAVLVMPVGIRVYEAISHWSLFRGQIFEILFGFYMMVYVFALFGLILWTLVVSIRDFFKTILKDEGYLTHTLPVSGSTLILSKEIAGVITMCVSGALLLMSLSILLVMRPGINLYFLSRMDAVTFVLCLIVLCICSYFTQVTVYVLSMMLGQMHRSSKGIISVGYYFAISVGMQILFSVILILLEPILDSHLFMQVGINIMRFANHHETMFICMLFGLVSVWTLICGIAVHFINVWLVNHKLNLE